jgi:hypothetical protein
MSDIDFLKTLKVGDEIIERKGYFNEKRFNKNIIVRETKKYFFILYDGSKIRKTDGRSTDGYIKILENSLENQKLLKETK